mmetsp:Transcript_47092/g.60523  ORF Transcript_47092/g.60523 Transcript_47092/m.60523 type:complete len:426 (+) Transcript_47092:289-1566(+)
MYDYRAEETCSASALESWSSFDDDAVTNYCAENSNELATFAANCCSDDLSICETYANQLCSSDDNYEPTNTLSVTCFLKYDSLAEAEAACPTDDADNGCMTGTIDIDGDGIEDHLCYCETMGSDTCVLDSYDWMEETSCAGGALDNWPLTDDDDYCTTSSDDYSSYASICCSDGESICGSGYCFSSSSTVVKLASSSSNERLTLMSKNDKKEEGVVTPIHELKVGDSILALDRKTKQPKFSQVTGLPNSPSVGQFIEITVQHEEMIMNEEERRLSESNETHQILRATPFHTFPLCDSNYKKLKHANELQVNDCLHSPAGKMFIHSVSEVVSLKHENTYTIQLADAHFAFVGGIATHSRKMSTKNKKDMATLHDVLSMKGIKKKENKGSFLETMTVTPETEGMIKKSVKKQTNLFNSIKLKKTHKN